MKALFEKHIPNPNTDLFLKFLPPTWLLEQGLSTYNLLASASLNQLVSLSLPLPFQERTWRASSPRASVASFTT